VKAEQLTRAKIQQFLNMMVLSNLLFSMQENVQCKSEYVLYSSFLYDDFFFFVKLDNGLSNDRREVRIVKLHWLDSHNLLEMIGPTNAGLQASSKYYLARRGENFTIPQTIF
jgi:hypothetical protein